MHSAGAGTGQLPHLLRNAGRGRTGGLAGAAKAVSEWFPDREPAWAVALFDSGSSIGGAVAPFLVVFLFHAFGSWRPAFLITASLGFIWLIMWTKLYHTPETHPRITPEELKLIQISRPPEVAVSTRHRVPVSQLFHFRQTWGIVVGRSLLDHWFIPTRWAAPPGARWDYTIFGPQGDTPAQDVEVVPLVFRQKFAGNRWVEHWTINGKSFPKTDPILVQPNRRYRLRFDNQSDEVHPLHLHRHSFELTNYASVATSGVILERMW
jgi:hypothetical protein